MQLQVVLQTLAKVEVLLDLGLEHLLNNVVDGSDRRRTRVAGAVRVALAVVLEHPRDTGRRRRREGGPAVGVLAGVPENSIGSTTAAYAPPRKADPGLAVAGGCRGTSEGGRVDGGGLVTLVKMAVLVTLVAGEVVEGGAG